MKSELLPIKPFVASLCGRVYNEWVSENGRSSGYVRLLRDNRDYRRLFIGQFISQTGDWFNSVALFTLLLSLTGSGEAVGFILILKLLPSFFAGPLAGVAADRYNRKAIMIVTDVLRGLLVLGFLLVRRPDQVWIVYMLTGVEAVISAFFEPAKSAAIPNIVSRNELVSANALASASWSVTLAFGASLGGIVTDAFGRDAAFVIDAVTFFISAAFIAFARIADRREQRETPHLSFADATGITDMIEGARYLKSNLRVMALLLVKSGWGLGGGVLLLLTIFGKQIFPIGRDGSTSIGLLYAARGFGALIGPVIARWVTDGSPRTLRKAISIAFFISAAFYLLFAQSPFFLAALVCAIGAHAGGSIQWVFSTTLLQLSVPDRFLGRVFALEMALLTLTMSLSTYLTGWAVDHAGVSARAAATVLGLAFLIPGAAWLVIQPWLGKADHAQQTPQAIEAESAD